MGFKELHNYLTSDPNIDKLYEYAKKKVYFTEKRTAKISFSRPFS